MSDLSITSTPASVAYKAGEKVTVAVSFDAPVVVDAANGQPYVDLQVGTEVRQAVYQSTSTTSGVTIVEFDYTVGNDTDDEASASSRTRSPSTARQSVEAVLVGTRSSTIRYLLRTANMPSDPTTTPS